MYKRRCYSKNTGSWFGLWFCCWFSVHMHLNGATTAFEFVFILFISRVSIYTCVRRVYDGNDRIYLSYIVTRQLTLSNTLIRFALFVSDGSLFLFCFSFQFIFTNTNARKSECSLFLQMDIQVYFSNKETNTFLDGFIFILSHPGLLNNGLFVCVYSMFMVVVNLL